ncbi:UNVERIFIED_CONTAM: hypothetical protein Sangu_2919100 [Sesamum angustifolium]|uniref:Uncharacterized protein n=1 Tax=Sesamum angustifolium TaxID=2727405 RepID=A0AAW2ILI1_9LAMI
MGGRCRGEETPPKAVINFVQRDILGEGDPTLKKGGNPLEASKEPSNPPADAPTKILVDAFEDSSEKEDPRVGEK